MTKKKRRNLSILTENLCQNFCRKKITETELKCGLNEILQEYEYLGDLRFQALQKALERAITQCYRPRQDEIWKLVNEVEPRLRG